MGQVDVVVVGAGIVGLATAWTLLGRDPTLRVAVIEKETRVGAHQSSHNSGVLHAGVYYAPGSLKARLCREGKDLLEAFCAERDVPVARNGKVIVALDESELNGLAELGRRATANRVEGLRELDRSQLRQMEPNVAGIAALHSPATGVVDFEVVCQVLADEVRDRGGRVLLGEAVTAIEERPSEVVVTTSRREIVSGRVITCGGLQSDRLAAMSDATDDVRIVPFRGSWYILDRPGLVNGSVYPVPDPRMPFLGVHVTPRIDGETWIGPNAVLVAAREGYERGTVHAEDVADTLRWPGTYRLAARFPLSGLRELAEDRSRHLYHRQVRRYVPDVEVEDLRRGPSGIRAQALRRDGSMVDDFAVRRSGRVTHLVNAPSPAATGSLAIARLLAAPIT